MPRRNYQKEITESVSYPTPTSTAKISTVNNTQGIIALIVYNVDCNNIVDGPALLLDNISNPGNLGTILRSAEWFGIKNVFVSTNTVDPYSPKTIQSSMGAHFHIPSIVQTNLIEVINIGNQPLANSLISNSKRIRSFMSASTSTLPPYLT